MDDGPVLEATILKDAEARGLPVDAVYHAAKALELYRVQKYGSGGRIRNGYPYYWSRFYMAAGWATRERV